MFAVFVPDIVTGTVSGRHCHPSLVVLDTLACDGWQHLAVPSTPAAEPSTNTTTDYCSLQHTCVLAGDHSKWPMNALLGSQLNRRLDAIHKAHEQGCAYAHVPLQPPVEWAESHFRLGACEADHARCSCPRAPRSFDAQWTADRSGKFMQHGTDGPRLSRTALAIRARLPLASTPWFDGSADGAEVPADELQVAIHLRRGDLSGHRLESDASRWVPDEYYEVMLPQLVSALAAASPIAVHVCSEWAAGWTSLAARWESHLLGAGAKRVRFHLGTPWPTSRERWGAHSNATNRDLIETFHHLVDADVLVTSLSGFSRAAARYSLGLVLQLRGTQPGECQRPPKSTSSDQHRRKRKTATSSAAAASLEARTGEDERSNHSRMAQTGEDGRPCLHRLPIPPTCTASTEARLERVVTEAEHVDFQCCGGRWRNATPRATHCIAACLAAGDDLRRRRPSASRRKHVEGDPVDDGMPIWSGPFQAWVWCAAKSRSQLLTQLHASSKRTPWELSVSRATADLAARRAALRADMIDFGHARQGWRSIWHLLSARSRRHEGRVSKVQRLVGGCCASAHPMASKPRQRDSMGRLAITFRRAVGAASGGYSTCAVVGSSGALLMDRQGPAIDSHELVIRFNEAPTAGFEPVVGSGTSLRLLNTQSMGVILERCDLAGGCQANLSCCPQVSMLVLNSDSPSVVACYQRVCGGRSIARRKAGLDASPVFHQLARPSMSGLYGIAVALLLCRADVDVYGFTSSASTGAWPLPPAPYHYYDRCGLDTRADSLDFSASWLANLSAREPLVRVHASLVTHPPFRLVDEGKHCADAKQANTRLVARLKAQVDVARVGRPSPSSVAHLLRVGSAPYVLLRHYLNRSAAQELRAEVVASVQECSETGEGLDRRRLGATASFPLIERFERDGYLLEIAREHFARSRGARDSGWLNVKAQAGLTMAGESSGGGWHKDTLKSGIKVLLYLDDVGHSNGPFAMLLNYSDRKLMWSADAVSGIKRRLSDSAVARVRHADGSYVQELHASMGSAVVFEISSAHRGMPCTHGHRASLTNYYKVSKASTMCSEGRHVADGPFKRP